MKIGNQLARIFPVTLMRGRDCSQRMAETYDDNQSYGSRLTL